MGMIAQRPLRHHRRPVVRITGARALYAVTLTARIALRCGTEVDRSVLFFARFITPCKFIRADDLGVARRGAR